MGGVKLILKFSCPGRTPLGQVKLIKVDGVKLILKFTCSNMRHSTLPYMNNNICISEPLGCKNSGIILRRNDITTLASFARQGSKWIGSSQSNTE